ncbi:MAG TPA: hypothetical protein PL051_04530 [Candidatus Saccharibacteria bacterium]|nr:hypothetical protein [Candidatus Saccharibacteria bacterium]
MVGRIVGGSSIAALIVLFILLQATTPSQVGPLGLLAVFFLLYVVLVGVATLILLWGSNALAIAARPFTSKRPVKPVALQKSYYYASVLALAPVMILAMKSIGSLGVYQLVLVGIFLLIGLLYVAKRMN